MLEAQPSHNASQNIITPTISTPATSPITHSNSGTISSRGSVISVRPSSTVYVHYLREGHTFRKPSNVFKKAFSSPERVVWTSPSLDKLLWSRNKSDKKPSSILASTFLTVAPKSNTSKVIVITSTEEVLELECETYEERDEWIKIFTWLKEINSQVSRPFNFQHQVAVTSDFKWELATGQSIKSIFDLGDILGQGTYGKVVKAKHIASGLSLAVKLVNVSSIGDVSDMKREVDVLKECRFKNIVDYFGCWGPDEDGNLWTLMNHCQFGSVIDLLAKANAFLSETQISYIVASTLQGLHYLHHHKRIIHRDVKARNILIEGDGTIKLTDFGISKQAPNVEALTMCLGTIGTGSPHWMAPEVVEDFPATFESDIWSLGITAIELTTGLPPRSEDSIYQVMSSTVKLPSPGLPPTGMYQGDDRPPWSPEFHDFVALCLQKNPKLRPKTSELLQHPFVMKGFTDSRILHPVLLLVEKPKDPKDNQNAILSSPEQLQQHQLYQQTQNNTNNHNMNNNLHIDIPMSTNTNNQHQLQHQHQHQHHSYQNNNNHSNWNDNNLHVNQNNQNNYNNYNNLYSPSNHYPQQYYNPASPTSSSTSNSTVLQSATSANQQNSLPSGSTTHQNSSSNTASNTSTALTTPVIQKDSFDVETVKSSFSSSLSIKVPQHILSSLPPPLRNRLIDYCLPPFIDIIIGKPQKRGHTLAQFSSYPLRIRVNTALHARTNPLPSSTCKIMPKNEPYTGTGILHRTIQQDETLIVWRRFNDFLWLHDTMLYAFPGLLIPPVPEKTISNRFEESVLRTRRQELQWLLQYIVRHPILCQTFFFHDFITLDEQRFAEAKKDIQSATKARLLKTLFSSSQHTPIQSQLPDVCEPLPDRSLFSRLRSKMSVRNHGLTVNPETTANNLAIYYVHEMAKYLNHIDTVYTAGMGLYVELARVYQNLGLISNRAVESATYGRNVLHRLLYTTYMEQKEQKERKDREKGKERKDLELLSQQEQHQHQHQHRYPFQGEGNGFLTPRARGPVGEYQHQNEYDVCSHENDNNEIVKTTNSYDSSTFSNNNYLQFRYYNNANGIYNIVQNEHIEHNSINNRQQLSIKNDETISHQHDIHDTHATHGTRGGRGKSRSISGAISRSGSTDSLSSTNSVNSEGSSYNKNNASIHGLMAHSPPKLILPSSVKSANYVPNVSNNNDKHGQMMISSPVHNTQLNTQLNIHDPTLFFNAATTNTVITAPPVPPAPQSYCHSPLSTIQPTPPPAPPSQLPNHGQKLLVHVAPDVPPAPLSHIPVPQNKDSHEYYYNQPQYQHQQHQQQQYISINNVDNNEYETISSPIPMISTFNYNNYEPYDTPLGMPASISSPYLPHGMITTNQNQNLHQNSGNINNNTHNPYAEITPMSIPSSESSVSNVSDILTATMIQPLSPTSHISTNNDDHKHKYILQYSHITTTTNVNLNVNGNMQSYGQLGSPKSPPSPTASGSMDNTMPTTVEDLVVSASVDCTISYADEDGRSQKNDKNENRCDKSEKNSKNDKKLKKERKEKERLDKKERDKENTLFLKHKKNPTLTRSNTSISATSAKEPPTRDPPTDIYTHVPETQTILTPSLTILLQHISREVVPLYYKSSAIYDQLGVHPARFYVRMCDAANEFISRRAANLDNNSKNIVQNDVNGQISSTSGISGVAGGSGVSSGSTSNSTDRLDSLSSSMRTEFELFKLQKKSHLHSALQEFSVSLSNCHQEIANVWDVIIDEIENTETEQIDLCKMFNESVGIQYISDDDIDQDKENDEKNIEIESEDTYQKILNTRNIDEINTEITHSRQKSSVHDAMFNELSSLLAISSPFRVNSSTTVTNSRENNAIYSGQTFSNTNMTENICSTTHE